MPTLSHLPSELLQEILMYMGSRSTDLEAFYQLCSHTRRVLTPYVLDDRKKLSTRYKTIVVSVDLRHILLNTLLAVLADPVVVRYIGTLQIDSVAGSWYTRKGEYKWDEEFDEDDYQQSSEISEHSAHKEIPEKDLEVLREALKTSPFFTEAEISSCYEDIKFGNDDILLAMLLPLLSHLSSIAIGVCRELPYVKKVMQRIARGTTAEGSALSVAETPLRNLSNLRLRDTTAAAWYIDEFVPFIALPSVRSISGYSLFLHYFDWDPSYPRSNATNLYLADFQLHGEGVKALDTWLRNIITLKAFTCDTHLYRDRASPEVVCGLLEKHASASLGLLQIVASSISAGTMTPYAYRTPISFHKFMILKALSVDYSFFNPHTEADLVDLLPASLEMLMLTSDLRVTYDPAPLVRLLEQKEKRVPRLSILSVSITIDLDSKTAIETAAVRTGVSFLVPGPDYNDEAFSIEAATHSQLS